MKVYTVTPVESVDGNALFFATKADAFRCARAVAAEGSTATVEVDTVRTGNRRCLFVDLLNRIGWSAGSEVVRVFPGKDLLGSFDSRG